jgi:hypothetical protein
MNCLPNEELVLDSPFLLRLPSTTTLFRTNPFLSARLLIQCPVSTKNVGCLFVSMETLVDSVYTENVFRTKAVSKNPNLHRNACQFRSRCRRYVISEPFSSNGLFRLSGVMSQYLKNSVRTSHKRKCASITTNNQLSIFRKRVAVYFENNRRHIKIVSRKMQRLFYTKAGGIYSNHTATSTNEIWFQFLLNSSW